MMLVCIFDRILKQQLSVTSVIGGSGPTYGWGDVDNSTIDALCVAEGEYAIVDFINEGVNNKNIFPRGQQPSGNYYPLVAWTLHTRVSTQSENFRFSAK